MRPLVFRLSASLIGGSVLVLLLGSLLFSTVPARSSRARLNEPARTGIITDTRWIDLIRSGTPRQPLNRAAVALPTLNLHLTDNLIAGQATSSASIMISVRRGSTVVGNAVTTPYPDGAGYFYIVRFDSAAWSQGGGGGYPVLTSGDVISLTQANASFTMTVPALTALVDISADQVYGSAPLSGVVTTYLYPGAGSAGPYTQTATTDANGKYQADYGSALDVRPRDNGYVAYSEAPNRATYLRFVAPFLRAQAGGSEISGLAAPRSEVVITITDAAGLPYAYWSAFTGPDGSFEPASGYWGIRLEPNDRIVAASAGQTFSMTVLTLTVQIDLANFVVEGNALVDHPVELLRFDGPLCCALNAFWRESPAEQATVTATVAGHYIATMALTRPNYGAAIVTAPDGNQTYARFAVPYLSARMGTTPDLSYQIMGQVAAGSTSATRLIQGPSGYFKDVRSLAVASDGYFSDFGGFPFTLDSGDVITVATAQGLQVALQLPDLTGQIDPVTDIISGTAPPGARLTLAVYNFEAFVPSGVTPTPTPYVGGGGGGGGGGLASPSYTAIVTATAQGEYLVNLHGVIDLNNYSYGEVSLTTTEGHSVSRQLGLSRQEGCDFYPRLIYVGGNQVEFAPCYRPGSPGFVRLHDASGHLKSQQALPVWLGPYFLINFYTGRQPVLIAPGDIIEVEWDDAAQFVPTPTPTHTPWPTLTPAAYGIRSATDNQLITIVVPTLTVQLDPAVNTLSGQAPASATVALSVYRGYDFLFTSTAIVDAQGRYTVNLPPSVTLAAGDVAQVSYKSIEPPTFSVIGVLPLLRAQLYGSFVDGVLPPLSAYTATLQTTPPAVNSYVGTASYDGAFGFGLAPIKPGDVITVTTAQHVLRLAMPTLTAHVERASATVFGQAPPLARLRVEPYAYGASQNVTATATGAYSVSFPGLAPLNTTYGKLTYFDAEGNQAVLRFATVHWDVVVNDNCLSGIADVAGPPAMIRLYNDRGGLKSTLTLTPTYSQSAYSGCFTATVQSGDRLTAQTTSATEVFTVPILTARHNYALQAVEGAAPPNHEVCVESLWPASGYPRTLSAAWARIASPALGGAPDGSICLRTYSDVTGHYGLDTSALHPPLLSRGRVYLLDAGGNSTSIYFTVTGYPAFLPIVRR